MGEVAVKLINVFGGSALLLGILANLDNAMSIILAAIGATWGVYKIQRTRIENSIRKEDLMIKRLERMQREDQYKSGKKE